MSENKRVPLIALGAPKEQDKPSKEPRKTVRIRVVLSESTEDTCPVFNYKDELAAGKKRLKGKEVDVPAVSNGLRNVDELADDDDDDVRRIARQMEEKYGIGVASNKRKQKGRKDDYADIGMGYDESDSFIDNTDGYDEMIPHNVTTLHGGFYINSGALEFKTDDEANSDFSSSSSDEETTNNKTASRIRKIVDSSDETDRENKTDLHNENPKKRKLQNGNNGLQPALKKKLVGQNNKIYIKKRRLLDPQKKTVKELLREKRGDLDMSIPTELQVDDDIATIEDDKNLKKPTVSSNVSDIIESVVKGSLQKPSPDIVVIKDDEGIREKTKTVSDISGHPSANGESSHEPVKPDVKLPENLSPEIVSVINSIKTTAKFNTDGQVIYNADLDGLILKLERKCKCLGKPSRIKVYEHLVKNLRCKLDAFVKHAKTLMLEDEKNRLHNLLLGLQIEIKKVMPNLLETHEKESQKILQKKFSQESVDNEEIKQLRMPKRRFQWNESTKKYFKDILVSKKTCLIMEGTRKENLEAPMLSFLKTNIQTLWPEGWMSINALNKIYTTYADPKRNLNNSVNSNDVSPQPSFKSNSSISITPVPVVSNDSSSSKVSLISKKSLPEQAPSQACGVETAKTAPGSPKKEINPPPQIVESVGKLKVKPPSELMIKDNSVIIIDSAGDKFHPKKEKNTNLVNKMSDTNSYCQVIDLSDKNDFIKAKSDSRRDLELVNKDTTITPIVAKSSSVSSSSNNSIAAASTAVSNSSTKHELSITPTYSATQSLMDTVTNTKTSDDIQKVMEDLKVLQKMSSPKKSIESSPSSSAVSVIAVNKNYSSKPMHGSSSSSNPALSRYDYPKTDLGSSFQEEFQKHMFSALIPPTKSSKNFNRFAATNSAGYIGADKFFQSSNNNFAQSSNGHKSTSSSQPATAPKSQQK